jgi:hypothetical protein
MSGAVRVREALKGRTFTFHRGCEVGQEALGEDSFTLYRGSKVWQGRVG